MYLKQEVISVQAQGYVYPQAYVRRSLAPGVGEENYRWEDFREAQSLPTLDAELAALRKTLADMKPSPLGMVEMWAGCEVPERYLLCEGQQFRQTGVPGTIHRHRCGLQQRLRLQRPTVHDIAGLLPPARLARSIVVGYYGSADDLVVIGAVGGKKTH